MKPTPIHYSAVRFTYTVKRTTKRGWVFGVSCYVNSVDHRTGGGGFVVRAAMDSNEQIADFIKRHPCPKTFYGAFDGCRKYMTKHMGPIFHELEERIYWGRPYIGHSLGVLEDYRATLNLQEPTR